MKTFIFIDLAEAGKFIEYFYNELKWKIMQDSF